MRVKHPAGPSPERGAWGAFQHSPREEVSDTGTSPSALSPESQQWSPATCLDPRQVPKCPSSSWALPWTLPHSLWIRAFTSSPLQQVNNPGLFLSFVLTCLSTLWSSLLDQRSVRRSRAASAAFGQELGRWKQQENYSRHRAAPQRHCWLPGTNPAAVGAWLAVNRTVSNTSCSLSNIVWQQLWPELGKLKRGGELSGKKNIKLSWVWNLREGKRREMVPILCWSLQGQRGWILGGGREAPWRGQGMGVALQ